MAPKIPVYWLFHQALIWVLLYLGILQRQLMTQLLNPKTWGSLAGVWLDQAGFSKTAFPPAVSIKLIQGFRARGIQPSVHGFEERADHMWSLGAESLNVLNARTEFCQQQNGFGAHPFPEPPDESPAGQHLSFGLLTPWVEKPAEPCWTTDLQKPWDGEQVFL